MMCAGRGVVLKLTQGMQKGFFVMAEATAWHMFIWYRQQVSLHCLMVVFMLGVSSQEWGFMCSGCMQGISALSSMRHAFEPLGAL